MRTKFAPSSALTEEKVDQSTSSSATSSKTISTRSTPEPREKLDHKGKEVVESTASTVERIAARSQVQPHRNRPESQLLADAVDQVAAIAFRQLVGAVAE